MPTVVQFRRGTTTQNNNFTGANGEISIDTDLDVIRVHDGATAGGFALVGTTASQTLTNKTLSSPTLSGTASGTVDISITGTISSTGNITGNYFFGNGSQLTGIDATSIQNGTSSMAVIASGGNIRGNIAGVTVTNIHSGGVDVTGTISATSTVTGSQFNGSGAGLTAIPAANVTGTLSVNTTGYAATVSGAAQANITSVGTLTSLTVTGNVAAGNVSGTNITGTLATAAQTNITSVGTLTGLNVNGSISASGTVTGTSFVGVATSARYADLAENYLADAAYIPGTVLEFGGELEVTVATTDHSTAVAGIVSTQPAYLMNSELKGAHPVSVALTGRVPCLVQGPVKKGTVLVSGVVPGTAMAIDNTKFEPGCVVGKAMSAIENTEIKTIEVAVGRL